MAASTLSALMGCLLVAMAMGQDASSKMVFFSDYPESKKPIQLTIRSPFEGNIEFVENHIFGVLVNVTSSDVTELSHVDHQYHINQQEIMLQVFENRVQSSDKTIEGIIVTIVVISCLVLVAMVTGTVCWFKFRRPIKKKKPATVPLWIVEWNHEVEQDGDGCHNNRQSIDSEQLEETLQKLQTEKSTLEQNIKKRQKIQRISQLRDKVSHLKQGLMRSMKGVKVRGHRSQLFEHHRRLDLAPADSPDYHREKHIVSIYPNIAEEYMYSDDDNTDDDEEEEDDDDDEDGYIEDSYIDSSGVPLMVSTYSSSENKKNIVEVRVALSGSQSPTITRRKQMVPGRVGQNLEDTVSSEEDALERKSHKSNKELNTSFPSSSGSRHSDKSSRSDRNGRKRLKTKNSPTDPIDDYNSVKPLDMPSPSVEEKMSPLTYVEPPLYKMNNRNDNEHNERQEQVMNGTQENDDNALQRGLKMKNNEQICNSNLPSTAEPAAAVQDMDSPLITGKQRDSWQSSESIQTVVPAASRGRHTAETVVPASRGRHTAGKPKKSEMVVNLKSKNNDSGATETKTLPKVDIVKKNNQVPSMVKLNGRHNNIHNEASKTNKPNLNGGPRYKISAPKQLHLTTFSIICVICLVTGVYSQLSSQSKVNIRVYVPKGYLQSASVFIQQKKGVKIINQVKNLDVQIYDVNKATVDDLEKNICQNKWCKHKCDQQTGNCVCQRGYRLFKEHNCIDVSECILGSHQCNENARCLNTRGSYMCICNEGFFGNGKTCKECRKYCPRNYYQVSACNETNDIQCQACSSYCRPGQFEYQACINTTDRICRDTKLLQFPIVSNNVVFEDQSKSHYIRSGIKYFDPQRLNQNSDKTIFTLHRGSGLSVRLDLKEAVLLPNFSAVNHSASNDNSAFQGTSRVLLEFCPHPMPLGYQLQLVMHNKIMTKAKYRNCSQTDNVSCSDGYFLDPGKPCQTFKQFGPKFSFHPYGSMLCTEPSTLTDLYRVSKDLRSPHNVFVDRSDRCAKLLQKCESCTIKCAQDIETTQAAACKVTDENVDNGWSPRLQLCQTCCEDANCIAPCAAYNACEPIRCRQGNLAEFQLNPSFPQPLSAKMISTAFMCHVSPSTSKPLYIAEFTVLQEGNPVTNKIYSIHQQMNKESLISKLHRHKFLNVRYSSSIESIPDVIEGNIDTRTFQSSQYNGSGTSVRMTINPRNSMLVRPKAPFAVNSQSWQKRPCNEESLEDLILQNGSPLKVIGDITVGHMGNGLYRLSNQSAQPFIYFEIPESIDILPHILPKVEVIQDSSLVTALHKNNTHWTIDIKGHVSKCPGLLHINVSEESIHHQPVFEYIIGVKCPRGFSVTFAVPLVSHHPAIKYFTIDITGENQTVKIRQGITKSSTTITETKKGKEARDKTSEEQSPTDLEMSLSFTLIGGFSTVILVLAVLLFCGSILKSANAYPDSRLHMHHIVFTIVYVVFRVAYSLSVTLTVFILVWKSLNSESWHIVQQYPKFVESVGALQQLEAGQINRVMLNEISRLDMIANNSKTKCQQQLFTMQQQVEQVHKRLSMDTNREMMINKVSLVMFDKAQEMVKKLQLDLIKFRNDYNHYVVNTVFKMATDLQRTVDAIHGNRWLRGAARVHRAIRDVRSAKGMSTKTFLDWMDMQHNITSLNTDLRLRNMPIPDLDNFMAPIIPQPSPEPAFTPTQAILPSTTWYDDNVYKDEVPSSSGWLSKESKESNDNSWIDTQNIITAIVILDVIWFFHRMAVTYDVARCLLYGSPVFVDCRVKPEKQKKKEPVSLVESSDKSLTGEKPVPEINLEDSLQTAVLAMAKEIHLRIMQTDCVPKLISVILVCLLIYVMTTLTDRVVSVSSLSTIGFFKAVTLSTDNLAQKASAQIALHEKQINLVELPFYEKMVVENIERYQLLVQTLHGFDCKYQTAKRNEFCEGSQPLRECTEKSNQKYHVDFIPCHLPKVKANPFIRPSPLLVEEELAYSIAPYISAIRSIVLTTSHILIVFVAILVLVDLLSATLWLYLQRFKLVQETLFYESELSPRQEHL